MLPNAAPSPPAGEQDGRSSEEEERKYKGVRRRKWGRWVSEIRLPNSRDRIWLGSYDTPEQAARAFDAASVCLRGPAGAAINGLNFPGSPPAVCGRTSDVQEVYAAAASHAHNNNKATAATEAPDSDAVFTSRGRSLAAARTSAPLQVSAERMMDWTTEMVANPPPLFSPTVVGSHAHLTLTAAATDVDMYEDETAACCPGLWSFDCEHGTNVASQSPS